MLLPGSHDFAGISMPGFDISVVGRVYVDHVFAGFKEEPELGTEIYASSYERSIGGGTAITSYWLGSLGRKVQVACLVGRDHHAWFCGEFDRAGVHTGLVKASDLNTGVTAAITLGQDREYFTHLGANAGIEEYLESPEILAGLCRAKHLHLTVPLHRKLARKVIGRAHASGLTVSLDVGYQPRWYADPENQDTLRELDFFFPNEKEAQLLGLSGRRQLADWFARIPDVPSPASARWVVIKQGSAGACAFDGTSHVHSRAPSVDAVDTTGAGEAFNAGFLDAFLRGGDIQAWLRRACVAGALSVGKLGGVSAAVGRQVVDDLEEETYGI